MVTRPPDINAYQFVVVASLRAQQLLKGCVPRVEGEHSVTTMAQMEVAQGRVTSADVSDAPPPKQCGWQL